MGLLVFSFFFFMVLLMLSLRLSFKRKIYFFEDIFRLAFITMLSSFFFFLTIVFLYFDVKSLKIISISLKLFLSGIIGISLLLINTTIKMPRFNEKNSRKIDAVNIIFHTGFLAFTLIFIKGFFWDSVLGFYFESVKIKDIPAIRIYEFFIFLISPSISILITFIKMLKEKKGIYRQQIAVYLAAQILTMFCWIIITLIAHKFSLFIIALIPFGYILLIFLTNRAFAQINAYDKTQVAFAVIRFLIFSLFFALTAGIAAAVVLTVVRNIYLQVILLVLLSFTLFVARNFVSRKFRWSLGDTKEYAKIIESDLQKINYEAGREKVLASFVDIVFKYSKTLGLEILITGEDENLNSVYSTSKNTDKFPAKTDAFIFLLEQNITVLSKSQVQVDIKFSAVKDELLILMTKLSCEIIILIRDGQKLIGFIGIAKKRRQEQFTTYDFDVINNIYSYFFLIIYYLKNIAKEDIILTVDREIEMSVQIIGSIQRNMDIVKGKVIEVDSKAYSAHQLGGDFTDFIKLSEDRYFFLIGDVAGKGLSASMSMVILKSVLHTYLADTPDFKELVVKLNVFIKENLPRGTFFAGLFGIIDFKTTTIYYLNCGIPLMTMYIDSYKNVIEIQGEGRVLGFVKNIKPFLKVRKITMNKDDIIVFTTDGLLDSANLKGDRFGNARVGRIIADNKDKTAKEISSSIYKSLLEFISRDIKDDVTILTFKHK